MGRRDKEGQFHLNKLQESKERLAANKVTTA